MDDLTGQTIRSCEFLRKLGTGGFGTIYLTCFDSAPDLDLLHPE